LCYTPMNCHWFLALPNKRHILRATRPLLQSPSFVRIDSAPYGINKRGGPNIFCTSDPQALGTVVHPSRVLSCDDRAVHVQHDHASGVLGLDVSVRDPADETPLGHDRCRSPWTVR